MPCLARRGICLFVFIRAGIMMMLIVEPYSHLRTTTVQHAAAVVHSRDYRCRNYLLLYRSRESGLGYDDMVGRAVSAGADRVSCKEFVCNGYCRPRRGGCAVWN